MRSRLYLAAVIAGGAVTGAGLTAAAAHADARLTDHSTGTDAPGSTTRRTHTANPNGGHHAAPRSVSPVRPAPTQTQPQPEPQPQPETQPQTPSGRSHSS